MAHYFCNLINSMFSIHFYPLFPIQIWLSASSVFLALFLIVVFTHVVISVSAAIITILSTTGFSLMVE